MADPLKSPAALPAALYVGRVVHKRLRPRRHALGYRVFSLLVDVDRIDEAFSGLRLIARNRFSLLSLYDRDFGAGGNAPLGERVRTLLAGGGVEVEGRRILLLTYPRVLGYVFNPLSVYFVLAPGGGLEAVVYEVSNTFSERRSYVIRAGEETGGIYAHGCAKELTVSPFASSSGRYTFRVSEPAREEMTVAVMFRDPEGPLIKTRFAGRSRPLSDRSIAGLCLSHPLLTLKVIAAIHYEALRLWLKGVPLVRGHSSPRFAATFIQEHERG